MAGLKTFDLIVGVVLVLHCLGNALQTTRGEITTSGKTRNLDGSKTYTNYPYNLKT